MNQLLNFGEIVAMNAYVSPDKVGARDLTRSLTFRGWNDRSCKLANALVGLALEKGDRIAVLAYNCLEWMAIYAAVASGWLAQRFGTSSRTQKLKPSSSSTIFSTAWKQSAPSA
jgi:fatty-acyl-CoA synthase